MLPPKFDLEQAKELIKAGTEKVVMMPWNGTYIPFVIRMLNATQLRACGDFSILALASEEYEQNEEDEQDAVTNFNNVIQLKNTQEKMLEFALVSPNFKEICELVNASDLVKDIKDKIAVTREKIKDKSLTIAQRKQLTSELDNYELYLGFMFPDDFMAAFTFYITQKGNTDIDKVTNDILLESALAAEKWHDRPSDYMEGVFTEYQKNDIDKQAMIVLHRFREQIEVEKSSKKWIRGKKKNRKRN